MGEQMTLKQVLEETIKIINGINVQVGLAETIAMPLTNARNNLLLCVDSLVKGDEDKGVKEQPEDAGNVQVIEIPVDMDGEEPELVLVQEDGEGTVE